MFKGDTSCKELCIIVPLSVANKRDGNALFTASYLDHTLLETQKAATKRQPYDGETVSMRRP